MCLGENSAHHAVYYFNAQLAALWETSVQCANTSGTGLKPLDRVRYDFALSEFHVGSRLRSRSNGSTSFSATFDKPRLEFLCNHQAVLYLKIKKGQLDLDYDRSDHLSTKEKAYSINDAEIAFCMDFGVDRIRGHSSKIGDTAHTIQLLVLDFQKAKLVSEFSPAAAREGLEYYMKKYLDFLHTAGLHVLFSLPDFDDERHSLEIDHSVNTHIIRNSNIEINEIFGISVVEINKFLSTKWLKSILYGDDDRHTSCLSEYHSTWTSLLDQSDIHFQAKFGAPKIRPLCGTEVILYFDIEEVYVYDSSDFSGSPVYDFSNWGVAVVCDVIRDDECSITRIKLDMSSVRYCEHISHFPGLEKTVDHETVIKATFLEFIINYYTAVIERSYYHYIYDVNTVETEIDVDIDVDFNDNESDVTEWHATHPSRGRRTELLIEISQLFGFDFIQVISGYTIAEHFRGLWQSAIDNEHEHTKCLTDWSFDDVLETSFGAIDIRLLSSKKAIVWIQIDNGSIKGSRGSKQHRISDWSVAFEVDLKFVDHEEIMSSTKTWYSRFKSSPAWKQHGHEKHRTFRHLCLDFTNARFLHNISKFGGLTLGNHSSISNVKTIVNYLQKTYFSIFVEHGHHILQSVPVWKTGSQYNSMGLTSVDFQVYSKYKFDLYRSQRISQSSDAFIVLAGMTCFRPFPSVSLKQVFEWILNIKGGYSLGFIGISKNQFIKEQLLRALSRVNASTTVVPIFPGSDDYEGSVSVIKSHGGWKLALTTWARRYRQGSGFKCDWERREVIDNEYVWDHSDRWSHEHEGAMDDADNGTYNVACVTRNYLQLPTSFKNGSMEVVIRGETSVEIGFHGDHKDWNAKGTSKWTIALVINSLSRGGGVSFDIRGDTKPRFDVPRIHGETSTSLDLEGLRSLLEIDLDGLVVDLRETFGGAWGYCFPGMGAYSLCNPILNRQGDVLFELQQWIAPSQLPGPVSRPLFRGSIKGQRPSLKGGMSIQKSKSSNGKIVEEYEGNGESRNGGWKAASIDKSRIHNRTISYSSKVDEDSTFVG